MPFDFLSTTFYYFSANGGLTKISTLPDSVTTHVLEAVNLQPLYGMCIAEPVEVTSTKDFLIDLDLPYSVGRMEQTNWHCCTTIDLQIYRYVLPLL